MQTIKKLLSDFIQTDTHTPKKNKATTENSILSQCEYPPSDADLVADKCAFIGELRETGLEGNEPAWHAALGVVRHCVEGEEKCHEFSAKSPDYNEALTNQKLHYAKQKDIQPTCCSTIEQYGFCKGCKHKGKVKTPIQLGVNIVSINEDLEIEHEDIDKNKAKELMRLAPKNNWLFNKQGIYKIVDDTPERITNTLFFIVDIIFETFEDETLVTAVIRYIKYGKVRNFKLPLKLLGDLKKLEIEFSGRGIFTYDKKYLKAYICDYIDCLKDIEVCKSVNSLGWQPDGSFVYNSKGDTFSKDGESTISVINNNARTYISGIEAIGSLEKWNGIQPLLKGDVFLPHVFSIMCSMGAPLLNFTDARGIILSLTGASGSGKSLAHEAALSVWGDPETAGLLQVSYTKNAVLGRAGALKNLPLRLDEITKIEPKLLKNLIYELVNGSGRGRSTKDGAFSNVSSNWRTLTLVNANGSLLENNMLVLGEAERNRILEIEVSMPANINCIGHDVGRIIKKNYGLAGARLAEEYVKNKPKVLDMLEIYQNKFQPMVEDDKRFWVSCVASALTAAQIANSLGIFNFNIADMEDWIEKELKMQTETNKSLIEEARGFSTYNEFVTALKDWLTGSVLILNEDFTINQSPIKETKARMVKNEKDEFTLYIRPPILKEFVRLYYIKSFSCVKKELGIGDAVVKRFSNDVVRCYEFKMK